MLIEASCTMKGRQVKFFDTLLRLHDHCTTQLIAARDLGVPRNTTSWQGTCKAAGEGAAQVNERVHDDTWQDDSSCENPRPCLLCISDELLLAEEPVLDK